MSKINTISNDIKGSKRQIKIVFFCVGQHIVDLPDAVAMGVALWDDIVVNSLSAYCYCCTMEEPAYGQVIIYDVNAPLSIDYKVPDANSTVVRTVDYQLFKDRLKKSLLGEK